MTSSMLRWSIVISVQTLRAKTDKSNTTSSPQPSERVGTSPRSLLNSAVFRNSAKCFRIRILQAPTCFRLHHCAKTTKRFNKTTSKNIFSVSWSAVDHVKNTAINNINIMVRCWGLVLPFGTWAAVRTDEATGELQLILYKFQG